MAEETPGRLSAWVLVGALAVDVLAGLVAIPLTVVIGKLALGLKDGAPVAALFIAETVLVPLAVWLPFYYGLIRKRAPGRGLVYFLVLLGATLVLNGGLAGLVYFASHRDAAERAATASAAASASEQKNLRTVLAESDAAARALAANESAVGLHTNLPGAAGEIARAAKAMLIAVTAAQDAADKTAEDLDYPAFMAPEKLGDNAHMAKMIATLGAVRDSVVLRDKQIAAAIAAYRATLAGARIPPNLKQPALANFDKLNAAQALLRAKRTDVQLRLIAEFQSQIRDLKNTRAGWTVQGNILMFTDKPAHDRYVAHQKTETTLGKEQHDLWKDSI